jgi:hypothetical protein
MIAEALIVFAILKIGKAIVDPGNETPKRNFEEDIKRNPERARREMEEIRADIRMFRHGP